MDTYTIHHVTTGHTGKVHAVRAAVDLADPDYPTIDSVIPPAVALCDCGWAEAAPSDTYGIVAVLDHFDQVTADQVATILARH